MTSPSLAISARNLTLTLGSAASPVTILRGIDLDIARGEVVALLGPSGSGKSSLMAVLSGLERASGGSLDVAGADFSLADITAVVAVDFARVIRVKPVETHGNIARWRAEMAGRPAMAL